MDQPLLLGQICFKFFRYSVHRLNGIFELYLKPNNDPICVHKDSKHPQQVLKEQTLGHL